MEERTAIQKGQDGRSFCSSTCYDDQVQKMVNKPHIELEQTRVIASSGVTHLKFQVMKE
jgi:hypothetical protein